MDQAISILQLQFGTDFGGLFANGYGQYVPKKSMPKFMAVGDQRFIQIVNVGDHWVCVANILTANTHTVFVYDSSYRKINYSLQVQFSLLMRGENRMKSHIRLVITKDREMVAVCVGFMLWLQRLV